MNEEKPINTESSRVPLPPDQGSDRRTFLKRGLAAAGSLAIGSPVDAATARRAHRRPGRFAQPSKAPNILVIVVDQLRTPIGPQSRELFEAVMPNLAVLRQRSVSFERHFTASNDCSPSRSTLLTGLYTHQTGCMITGRSHLNPGFPTWGTLLRDMGYDTSWWGKWHLNPHANASLEPYGFSGGTYPSPNGSPGQGTQMDPLIAGQFAEWFSESAGRGPWCTTVSFVNPHDVAWWYRLTEQIPQENSPPLLINQMPTNFETPEQLQAAAKPAVQRSLQDTAARSFGAVPFTGPDALPMWTSLLNTYLMLQANVDRQIGAVLRTLATKPALAANTVVLFTSDHGEYGGAHGLRGKGAGAYEEAIRVPLYVFDPRSRRTRAPALPRHQLTSSVDVVALLLSIATGSDSWRQESTFSHLADRADLAGICANPIAPGRDWILHATDEDVTEFASDPYASEAPRHVLALRTASAKLGVYCNWQAGGIEILPGDQETELYDYANPAGRAELENLAGGSVLEEELYATLIDEALPGELRAPLPASLRHAYSKGMANYLAVEEYEAERVAYAHLPGSIEPVETAG